MSKFKAGDKVVRIGGGDDAFMKRGNTHTVKEISNGWLKFDGCPWAYDPLNFSILKDNVKESQFQNMKFKVNNVEHSKLIQNELFKLGYLWTDEQKYKHKNAQYLYASEDGQLSWSNNIMYFENTSYPEYKLEPIAIYTLVKVEPEYVEYNGVKYLKEEFEQALSNLKTF